MEINGESPVHSVTEIFEKCIGCKWTMHVLTQIRSGVHRPGELQRTAEGLTTKVLNVRLAKLVSLRIVERHSYPEIPPRVEYRLTAFGERFVKIFDQIDELQREFGHTEPAVAETIEKPQ
ncbi:MAG: helix-turn-helix domain-containing protein [Planctomycetota bacterium]